MWQSTVLAALVILLSLLISAGASLAPAEAPSVVPAISKAAVQAIEPFATVSFEPSDVTSGGVPVAPIAAAVWAFGTISTLAVWMKRWRELRRAVCEAHPAEDSPEQVESRVEHEMSHVRRHNNLAAQIHMLVEAVFWLPPLVSWIGARLIEEREWACDEEVLQKGRAPEAYAQGIVEVCRFYLRSPPPCASGITGSDLQARVSRIMAGRVGARLTSTRKFALCAAAVVALDDWRPAVRHSQVAKAFFQLLRRKVVDRTVLTGVYDQPWNGRRTRWPRPTQNFRAELRSSLRYKSNSGSGASLAESRRT